MLKSRQIKTGPRHKFSPMKKS